jgi:hypothetical protein
MFSLQVLIEGEIYKSLGGVWDHKVPLAGVFPEALSYRHVDPDEHSLFRGLVNEIKFDITFSSFP